MTRRLVFVVAVSDYGVLKPDAEGETERARRMRKAVSATLDAGKEEERQR